MRRALLALVSVGLLAGSALAAEGDPLERHTAADMAKARSVMLRRADFGRGWTSERVTNPDESLQCTRFRIDESGLVETGEADSPVFSRELAGANSTASVYRTARMAAASWSRGIRPGLAACLAEDAERTLSQPRFRLKTVAARRVPYARLAPSTAAYRIVFAATDGQPGSTSVPFVVDVVFLRDARILAGVSTISVGRPFPPGELRRLASAVARRMR
jgi:hypothetical protein